MHIVYCSTKNIECSSNKSIERSLRGNARISKSPKALRGHHFLGPTSLRSVIEELLNENKYTQQLNGRNSKRNFNWKQLTPESVARLESCLPQSNPRWFLEHQEIGLEQLWLQNQKRHAKVRFSLLNRHDMNQFRCDDEWPTPTK